MLSPQQEEYILENAYVPEHIIPLMVGISGAEPFWIENYVFYAKADWLIFVGYPLGRHYQAADFTVTLNDTMKKFNPAYTWFIVPEMPESLLRSARQRESDEYYRLDIQNQTVKKNLVQVIQKVSAVLQVEKNRQFSKDHVTLTKEFLKREKTTPQVRELFLHMPRYIDRSPTSLVLSAWDKKGNLSAFYVMELAAGKFATYVVGCFSKTRYVPHASDLLFSEMINLARENQKEYIHLGLGVNPGIRRFKRKWGGTPFLRYEFCELSAAPEEPLPWLRSLEAKL
jgi:predicted RNA-binding protein